MRKLLIMAKDFVRKNRFVSLLLLAALFVALVVAYRYYFSKPTYIYVKVKVGQGYWWANTQRPSSWFVDAITKAREEKDLTGKPLAKVISVSYYPYYGGGQYDVYAVLRLRVSKVGREGKYNFNRSTIGVGVPIDFEFNTVQFSGTVIGLSEKPFNEPYVEKTVTLIKRNAFPWEYDAIVPGDSFFNGETKTFQVVDRYSYDTAVISNDNYGNYIPVGNMDQKYLSEAQKYIIVKARLKGKMVNGQFFYGEDQQVLPGRFVSIATSRLVFNDFVVAKVE